MFNDVLVSTDSGDEVVLLLLDWAAAGVVHLRQRLGIWDSALDWFRSFCVCLDYYESSFIPLLCGVPQGSVLGPSGLHASEAQCGHQDYADDTQIYLRLKRKTLILSSLS